MALNVTRASQLGSGPSGKAPGPIYKVRYTHDSSLPADSKVVFGTAPRFAKAAADSGPGPGAYSLPPQRAVAFSLRFREKFGTAGLTSAKDNPAPGHVVRLETGMTRKKNAPAFSLRARRVQTKTNDFTPAPGHSQHMTVASEGVFDSTKPNLPGIKFTTAGRPEAATSSLPDVGPGAYDALRGEFLIEGNRRVPAWSMKGRPKARAADRVQPDFHADTAWQREVPISTLRSAPAFSMSSRTKFGDPYA